MFCYLFRALRAMHICSWLALPLAFLMMQPGWTQDSSPKKRLPDVYETVSAMIQDSRLTDAEQKINAHLLLHPRDPQMRFLRGVLEQSRGQWEQATETMLQLTREFPELPEPYNNLAVAWSARNQPEKAREALEAALRISPNYATAHENLAQVYLTLARQSSQRAQKISNKP
jgi:Flp pilus assembly protein TadD